MRLYRRRERARPTAICPAKPTARDESNNVVEHCNDSINSACIDSDSRINNSEIGKRREIEWGGTVAWLLHRIIKIILLLP